jgi:hydroxymethylglutaryl-CoA lyase
MHYPDRIEIREVSPRDGLQGETRLVSSQDKVRLIDMLADTGVKQINATSFVSPKAVPQMADAEAVMARIERRPGIVYDASVPNLRGAQRAFESHVDALVIFVDASEGGNRSSVGRSIGESMREAEAVIAEARRRGLPVTGTVGTAFGSAYEGAIAPKQILAIAGRFAAAGATGLSLGDTSGEATPRQVSTLLSQFPDVELSLHLHDTRGLGLANVLAAMDAGVTRFDAAVGGIGGNPFIQNSSGNVCTEDLVHMCDDIGIHTGINLHALLEVNRFIEKVLGYPPPGKVARVGRSKVASSR